MAWRVCFKIQPEVKEGTTFMYVDCEEFHIVNSTQVELLDDNIVNTVVPLDNVAAIFRKKEEE